MNPSWRESGDQNGYVPLFCPGDWLCDGRIQRSNPQHRPAAGRVSDVRDAPTVGRHREARHLFRSGSGREVRQWNRGAHDTFVRGTRVRRLPPPVKDAQRQEQDAGSRPRGRLSHPGPPHRSGHGCRYRTGIGAGGERLVQLDACVGNVVQPAPRVLFETPAQQPPHALGCLAGKKRPVRFTPEDRDDGVGESGPGKRVARRQHLVEHASEREDVGALVERLAARLFRAHIGNGAQDNAALRRVRRHRRRIALGDQRFRQAKVEHL